MKGVAIFLGLFLLLMALLLWAKSQPAAAAPTPITASKILPPEAPTRARPHAIPA